MGDNSKRERMTNDTEENMAELRNGERLNVKDVTHQPVWIRWPLYIIALAIVVTCLYIVGKLMPYEPLKITDIEIEPSTACGGEEVSVKYTGRMEGGLYTIDSLDGFAYWVSGEDDRPYSSIYFEEENLEPFDEITFDGPTRRVSPWPAGEWHAGVDAKIYGKRFGFVSVEETIHLESDDYLETAPRSSEQCQNVEG